MARRTFLALLLVLPLAGMAATPTAVSHHPCADDEWGTPCRCLPQSLLTPGASSTGLDPQVSTDYRQGFVVALPSSEGLFYLAHDEALEGTWLFSTWVYQETNSVPGLQRHDAYCYTDGYNSTLAADRIVW